MVVSAGLLASTGLLPTGEDIGVLLDGTLGYGDTTVSYVSGLSATVSTFSGQIIDGRLLVSEQA